MSVQVHEGQANILYGGYSIPAGNQLIDGYLAQPDERGSHPLVIVIPGLFGISSNERGIARSMARKGLTTLVVHPYSDRPTTESEALDAYNDAKDDDMLRLIDNVIGFTSSPDLGWTQVAGIGLLGLDVGGRFALLHAGHRRVATSVAVVQTPLAGDEDRQLPVADQLQHLAVPVLGLFGTDDELVPAASVDEAQRRNPGGRWLLYDGVGHGFMDPTSPNYDEAAALDATSRLVSFFKAAALQPV